MLLEFHHTSRWWKLQESSMFSILVAFGNVGSPFVRFMLALTDGAEDFTLVFLLAVKVRGVSYILDIYIVRLLLMLNSQEIDTLVEDVIGVAGFVLDWLVFLG